MSGSFEKSVKGGTKIKLAPPKAKYVEHILIATHAGNAGVAEIFRALQGRLRDSTWTVVFKALILVHLMIREGEPNITLKYLAESPSRLAISNFSDVQIQGTNIRHYYTYLLSRAKAYKDTRVDWVRDGVGRLKRQTVDKGLLRETEVVQNQIKTLLQCDLLSAEAENEISICAFRLLTLDLLVLFGIMNEGAINVLEHYFEMSKVDAQRALAIYKNFARHTNAVVIFLATARKFEYATRLEIPKLKHAPTSLTSSLEEYLSDPDFENNRRQYLARQGSKSLGNTAGANQRSNDEASNKKSTSNGLSNMNTNSHDPQNKSAVSTQLPVKTPAPELIDFFDSIEQYRQPQQTSQPSNMNATGSGTFPLQQNPLLSNGQPLDTSNPFASMQQQQQQQQQQHPSNPQQALQYNPSYASQHSSPQFAMGTGMNNQFTGANSFTALPGQQMPQQPMYTGSLANTSAPGQFANLTGHSQGTNPFRQSVYPQPSALQAQHNPQLVPAHFTGQGSNPFANQTAGPGQNMPHNQTGTFVGASSVTAPTQQMQPTGMSFASAAPTNAAPQHPPPFIPQQTGTNPFARMTSPVANLSPPPIMPTTGLAPNQTGTNPFRQSAFVNQQTGQPWQANQGTMGGLEHMQTVPVFPRSGQPSTQTSPQNPWG